MQVGEWECAHGGVIIVATILVMHTAQVCLSQNTVLGPFSKLDASLGLQWLSAFLF